MAFTTMNSSSDLPVLELRLTFTGSTDLAEAFSTHIEEHHQAALSVLIEEAETIRGQSMDLVPVDQGILRASALTVLGPGGFGVEDTPTDLSVTIGYGGAAASYALVQHETPPDIFTHAPGRSWKYLEQPFLAAAVDFQTRLATKLATRFVGSVQPEGGETFAP